jgi:hydroxymethylpyrimidine pyrophosphatase-like HAD family hydrolase
VVRLIGIDADGTLLDDEGGIPEANLEAVVSAVAAGVHVAVVTGRSYPSIRPLVDRLPATTTLTSVGVFGMYQIPSRVTVGPVLSPVNRGRTI